MDKEFIFNDISLYNDDCMNFITNIDDKSIDMILCDLPYGVTCNKLDKRLNFDTLWILYNRIIKDAGCIALFCQGDFYIDLVNSNRKNFRYDLIWNKVLTTGFLNANRMPLRQHEQIAIFYKQAPTYNPQFSFGKPLHSKGNKYKTKQSKNQNYGNFNIIDDVRKNHTEKYPCSILTFSKSHPSVSIHSTEKPVELFEYLIKTYTNENDLVLDNCIGSGTTAIACFNTNRKCIGIELNEDYFNKSVKRFKNHISQQTLNLNL
jgi:site-specific DNA-methyltransferase (adenine-specific)